MSWLALHRSVEASALLQRHPTAFLLLTQIALRARYETGVCPVTKLGFGQAFIGDFKEAGIASEMAYRHAKSVLLGCNFATFKGTNKGTIATLCSSAIYSISAPAEERPSEQPDNRQGTTKNKETRKQGTIPQTPAGESPSADGSGGGDGKQRCLPAGWSKMTAKQRGRCRVLMNTPLMERIGEFVGQKPTTLWTVANTVALKEVAPPDDEVEIVEEYYLAELSGEEPDYRRRGLQALLNNWSEEVTRARHWKVKQP
jgi:hypothetical protein